MIARHLYAVPRRPVPHRGRGDLGLVTFWALVALAYAAGIYTLIAWWQS